MEQIIKNIASLIEAIFFEEGKINIFANKYLLICYFMLL